MVDNKMGPKTIMAINKIDARQLFDVYQKNKVNYYTNRAGSILGQNVFLSGWLRRVSDIKFGDD